jgi:hypothetical protein
MAASLTRLIRTLPVPLFGSLNTAAAFTIAKSKALPRMVGWAVPLAIGGLWFVWPAVDDSRVIQRLLPPPLLHKSPLQKKKKVK